jgi:hypothetical protein
LISILKAIDIIPRRACCGDAQPRPLTGNTTCMHWARRHVRRLR